ncbi:hypothetical protein [Thermoplasma sp.]|uniref:hypothetical protein n=1 Tax=Thermoplasma sp. TaxID=1973142 RepID=UPI0012863F76|nr:hypothetical protein [Thermoplasma sp.]KAA8922003.1 MAG: hypothetical protein F6Q11_06675 [Thermoplasma sp.]
MSQEIINLESYDENARFRLKTEAALILDAQRIKALSKDPSRFEKYIEERLDVIFRITGKKGEIKLVENGKIILDYDGKNIKVSFD